MANVATFSDERIEELLIEHGGQPTKVAKVLNVSYVQVYRRIRQNPELLEIQSANRQKTFQDLSNFTIAATLGGLMKTPSYGQSGEVLRDDSGNPVFTEVIIDERTRLDSAHRLMNLFKGDEGIRDQIEITSGTITGVQLVDDDEDNEEV